jgi:hypothetical protein
MRPENRIDVAPLQDALAHRDQDRYTKGTKEQFNPLSLRINESFR